MKGRTIAFFALLWRFISWTWSILTIGIVVGVLGNLAYTYFTTGNVNFTDPRTLTIVSFLHSHLYQLAFVLVPVLLLTVAAYIAYHRQQDIVQEAQRAHAEALVDVAKGVRKVLEELNFKAITNSLSSSSKASVDQGIPLPATTWNVPYRRNPFFIGREDLIKEIHDRLTSTNTAALTQAQAINGLGGIGKTQIAVEYAYRYRDEYHFILWVRAATRDTLISDFTMLADLLLLREKNEQDHNVLIASIKRWLTNHSSWLLILDNADDLDLVYDFLPAESSGHILLTTRAQAVGSIAHSIEVEKMDKEEGIMLLLLRAKVLAPDTPLDQVAEMDYVKAKAIVEAVDGLPLAIDQAGAYIEETGCNVSDYLDRYQQRQMALLKRRGRSSFDHPEPVGTTWSLSFEQVEHANPAAAELLKLCTFLSPDAIPEEIIIDGSSHLGPLLQPFATDPSLLDEVIGTLRRFSLVHRNSDTKTLNIHRLVQAILKESMNNDTQHIWAERSVLAVNHIFPEVAFETWDRCQRYLPHAQVCALLIEKYKLFFPEAARLLNLTGFYLYKHAQYIEARPLLHQALVIREQVLGPKHPDTANSLNNLAILYHAQGQYEQAKLLLQRALAIREQVLGPNHIDTANCLNNLASLYRAQGQYEQAKLPLQRALTIREQVLGPNHPDTATSLNNLASLYRVQGQYEQAQPLLQRALTIREQVLGPKHPDTANSLSHLAALYHTQGQYEQAQPLLQRALAIREQVLGPKHPDIADSLNNLAILYHAQGQYEQAKLLLHRALAISEQMLEPDHPYRASSIHHLAEIFLVEHRYKHAELLFQQALAIREKVLGTNHLDTASSMECLADLYQAQDYYEQAEQLLRQALTIYEQVLGPNHRDSRRLLENYTQLLQKIKIKGRVVKPEA